MVAFIPGVPPEHNIPISSSFRLDAPKRECEFNQPVGAKLNTGLRYAERDCDAEGKGSLEKLEMKREHAWDRFSRGEVRGGRACGRYRMFLDAAKTERDAVGAARRIARKTALRRLEAGRQQGDSTRLEEQVHRPGGAVAPGRFRGVSIVAPTSTPRGWTSSRTRFTRRATPHGPADHYYGGIKKYQWATIPWRPRQGRLGNGKEVDICVGEIARDPGVPIEDWAPCSRVAGQRHLDEG